MKPGLRTRLLLWAPGLALAVGAMVVVLEGPSPDRTSNALLAGVGPVLVWSVAVAVRLRYPERPLGSLLFVLACLYATRAFAASPDPYLFTLARVTSPVTEVLLIWLMLAFPTGRLRGRRERVLVAAGASAVILLWLPGLMLSAQLPLPGQFVMCQALCPRNVLFVVDWPEASSALNAAFRAVGVLILVATAAALFDRLRQATPLMRRALAPVLIVSMARVLAVGVFLATAGNTLALTLTFWAVPLAIALGLLRGRLYAARALQRLVRGLRGRPDAQELRALMSRALDDPSLSIAYGLEESGRWVDADGHAVVLPDPAGSEGRVASVLRNPAGGPAVALVHDAALLEEPTLLDAVADSMQVALESHRLEAEIKASTAREAGVAQAERHRIERDLHDGAQQRLIALRMKLSVAGRLLDQNPRRAALLIDELGSDVEAAIVELRSLARGVAPPLLVERGLAAALREAAQRAALPVRTEIHDVGRCADAIESAVYYCCLEALQNAAKHAGPGATAHLSLRRDGDRLAFRVADDGAGAASQRHSLAGQGRVNMRERIEAVGGRLDIHALAQRGFEVNGTVPAAG
jgi:signal transduction histidine kinase